MAISEFWLRWFGSRPHLVGSAVALLLIIAGLFGVLETLLRPYFGLWWQVALAGYLVGWALTSLMMWLPGRVRRGRVAPRSWLSTVLPELDSPQVRRRPGVREKKALFTIGMVVFVAGMSFLLLRLLGTDRAQGLGGILSGIAAMLGLFLVWNANARPTGRDRTKKSDPPDNP